MTSRVRAAATHPAPSHPATPLSPSLSLLLSFFALTLLLTRRLSGKPLHLAMRCKSTGRGTQLVRSRKWEGKGEEASRAAEEALTVPTSLPLATRQSRLDSTLMSSIFSRTFCRYFVVSPSSSLPLLLLLLLAYNAAMRKYAKLQQQQQEEQTSAAAAEAA